MKWFVRPFLVSAGVTSGYIFANFASAVLAETTRQTIQNYNKTRQGEDK